MHSRTPSGQAHPGSPLRVQAILNRQRSESVQSARSNEPRTQTGVWERTQQGTDRHLAFSGRHIRVPVTSNYDPTNDDDARNLAIRLHRIATCLDFHATLRHNGAFHPSQTRPAPHAYDGDFEGFSDGGNGNGSPMHE